MAIEQVKLENLLKEKFPDANILVKDLAGDNNIFIDIYLIIKIIKNIQLDKLNKIYA